MDPHGSDGQRQEHTPPPSRTEAGGRIVVRDTLPKLGTSLGLLVAEVPERMQAFVREAARLDQPFKRWEYVRGVHGLPGAGAALVGRLPEGMSYTGFEGYWAGSGMSAEEIVAAEAQQGILVLHHIAELTGTTHALAAGLDIQRHPRVHTLIATALGQDLTLAALNQLEPVFGELLARLRATAETSPHPDQHDAFQIRVATATQGLPPSVYSDPVQHRLLIDLAEAGQNIVSDSINEVYEIPPAPAAPPQSNPVQLNEREQLGYRLIGEIGRLGHPTIRALLYVQGWLPYPSKRPPREAEPPA